MMTLKEKKLFSKLLLDSALLEARGFNEEPEVSLDHSPLYMAKINGIFKGENEKPRSLKLSPRVLLIAAIIIALIITAVACAPIIRRFIVRFIDGNYEVIPTPEENEVVRQRIDDIYTLTIIPDGFFEVEPQPVLSDMHTVRLWMKGEENIVLAQSVWNGGAWNIDGERTYTKIICNGIDVYYSEEFGYYDVSWIYDGYLFTITCPSSYEISYIERMIGGVKIK